MEAYFGTNIPTLHSRQHIEVFIFDRNKERVDSVIFALDDGLSKDHGMVGKK